MAQGIQTFKLPRSDDRAAITLLKKIGSYGQNYSISVSILEGISFDLEEFGEENVKAGRFALQSMILDLDVEENQRINVHLSRYEIGNPNNVSSGVDFWKINFSNAVRFIKNNPRVADKILGLVAGISPSALAIENARGFEVVNELVVNQNAVHTRMMESLNDALEDFIERQRKLEEEAAQKEEERNKKHAAAMQSLQDQQAELDRQSHISERRRLGREVLNPEKLGTSLSERLPVTFFGVCVFLVSMIAGGVFAFQSIASLEALSSDIKVLDLTRKLMENLPPYSPEDVLGLSQYEALKEIVDGLPVLTWFLGAKVLISGLLAVGCWRVHIWR